MLDAEGEKRTCPTLRLWPESLAMGAMSEGSSVSVCRVKSVGTRQMKTLLSSEPEAMMWSLKGFLWYGSD